MASLLILSLAYIPKPRVVQVITNYKPYAFIHIPKTGGTTFKHWIQQHPQSSISSYDHEEIATTALFYQQTPITIIRDPIDRFISSFYYWKYGSEDIARWRRAPNWKKADHIETVNDLVTILKNPNHPRYKQTKRNIFSMDHITWMHFLPQSYWIAKAEQHIYFICYSKTELSNNIEHIMKKIGIDYEAKELLFKNRTLHKPIDENILSAASIAWIRKQYAEDQALFEKYCLKNNTK